MSVEPLGVTMSVVQFAPFRSAISIAFWHALARRKLDEYGLSDAPVPLRATLRLGSPLLHLDHDSLIEAQPPTGFHAATGTLLNCNTIEDFKKLPLKSLLDAEAAKVWSAILDGSWESNPSGLVRPLLICYADLKRHDFRFVFACPALRFTAGEITASDPRPLAGILDDNSTKELNAILDKTPLAVVTATGAVCAFAPGVWKAMVTSGATPMLAIADPCDEEKHPGWPLRNALLALAVAYGTIKLTVLCMRPSGSFALDVELPAAPDRAGPCPAAVGWEIPQGSRLQPRVVSLAHTMDPHKLMDNAVDLNLKLMRWRTFPSLDLPRVAATRCLLLGAGTLGCNVARALLGWGVRNFTFVDNARVSYSNPVRQSLFAFDDCLDGGKPKATAAAERLKAIFPGVSAAGRVMTIPMPGHFVGKDDEERTRAAATEVADLVAAHDAIFLLSDSRECRWLPTLLGAALGKLVITVGLGFECFVVMRHGIPTSPHRVGCYFCSDVVAPRDSITDRTLDQACTVTRPGLSFMASALAAELFISVLHHPDGAAAPTNAAGCPLGPVPHQIRGFLSEWNMLRLSGEASSTCVACSETVVKEYRSRGFSFLLEVFNNPAFLEELSGLNELRRQQEKAASEGVNWATAESDDF